MLAVEHLQNSPEIALPSSLEMLTRKKSKRKKKEIKIGDLFIYNFTKQTSSIVVCATEKKVSSPNPCPSGAHKSSLLLVINGEQALPRAVGVDGMLQVK